MEYKLDPWQRDFLSLRSGNKILNCGRRIGKTYICALDAVQFGLKHKNTNILCIAPTERQAFILFEEIFNHLMFKYPKKVVQHGRKRPTKHIIHLVNGTRFLVYPVGAHGVTIRGLTVHRLYIDEASRCSDEIFAAVTPMLLTTQGDMILLSTPHGKQGYFYRCWINQDKAFEHWTRFYKTTEEVVQEREICPTWTEGQKDFALNHLKQEKATMTTLEYGQEYEARFLDDLRQLYPDDLVALRSTRSCDSPIPVGQRYLGVDIAAEGGDETVFITAVRTSNNRLIMTEMNIKKNFTLTDTVRMIQHLHSKKQYDKIYIDSGGLGKGVLYPLLEDPKTKYKVVAIDNSAVPIHYDEKDKKKVLKTDLHANLLHLLELGNIELIDDPRLKQSMKSVQIEYIDARTKIFGDYTHCAEALTRAAFCMIKPRRKLWAR